MTVSNIVIQKIRRKNFFFQRLNEAIKAKNECEEILLSKFVDILNSKKRKIFELSTKIELETKNSTSKIDQNSKGRVKNGNLRKKVTAALIFGKNSECILEFSAKNVTSN